MPTKFTWSIAVPRAKSVDKFVRCFTAQVATYGGQAIETGKRDRRDKKYVVLKLQMEMPPDVYEAHLFDLLELVEANDSMAGPG